MASTDDVFPITGATALAAYDSMFAPWVRQLGLRDFSVSVGRVSARLPESEDLNFRPGTMCGQALMSAIDTLAAMAMCTTERMTKGTVYQHTHFVRPAKGDDFIVEANVLRFGKASAFCETRVTLAGSGELVAHAVLEFAF
jgi:acyl-coenzyme A thioesterase PaaI-like protein